jgi:hypothetical protein
MGCALLSFRDGLGTGRQTEFGELFPRPRSNCAPVEFSGLTVTQQDSVLPKSLKAGLCENGLRPAPNRTRRGFRQIPPGFISVMFSARHFRVAADPFAESV